MRFHRIGEARNRGARSICDRQNGRLHLGEGARCGGVWAIPPTRWVRPGLGRLGPQVHSSVVTQPQLQNCGPGTRTSLSRISGKGGKKPKLARGVNKHAARTNYLSAIAATSASAIDAAYHRKQLERHQGHARPYVKATLSLARQRFKVKYKLMTTDAVYDKEILIASHFDRRRRQEAQRKQSNIA